MNDPNRPRIAGAIAVSALLAKPYGIESGDIREIVVGIPGSDSLPDPNQLEPGSGDGSRINGVNSVYGTPTDAGGNTR